MNLKDIFVTYLHAIILDHCFSYSNLDHSVLNSTDTPHGAEWLLGALVLQLNTQLYLECFHHHYH